MGLEHLLGLEQMSPDGTLGGKTLPWLCSDSHRPHVGIVSSWNPSLGAIDTGTLPPFTGTYPLSWQVLVKKIQEQRERVLIKHSHGSWAGEQQLLQERLAVFPHQTALIYVVGRTASPPAFRSPMAAGGRKQKKKKTALLRKSQRSILDPDCERSPTAKALQNPLEDLTPQAQCPMPTQDWDQDRAVSISLPHALMRTASVKWQVTASYY